MAAKEARMTVNAANRILYQMDLTKVLKKWVRTEGLGGPFRVIVDVDWDIELLPLYLLMSAGRQHLIFPTPLVLRETLSADS